MKARTANWMLTVMLACLLPSAGVLAQTLRVAISGRYGRMHNLMLGEPIGFEVDLARALAKALGKQLVILDSEDLGKSSLAAVQAGEVEMSLNAVTITEDRKKRVDFTRPYIELEYRLAGRKGERVTTVVDLAGKKVAVPTGLTLNSVKAVLQIGLLSVGKSELVEVGSVGEAVARLNEERVDFAVGEDVALSEAIRPYRDLEVTGPPLGKAPIGIAVRKGTAKQYDDALVAIEQRRKALIDKWRPGKMHRSIENLTKGWMDTPIEGVEQVDGVFHRVDYLDRLRATRSPRAAAKLEKYISFNVEGGRVKVSEPLTGGSVDKVLMRRRGAVAEFLIDSLTYRVILSVDNLEAPNDLWVLRRDDLDLEHYRRTARGGGHHRRATAYLSRLVLAGKWKSGDRVVEFGQDNLVTLDGKRYRYTLKFDLLIDEDVPGDPRRHLYKCDILELDPRPVREQEADYEEIKFGFRYSRKKLRLYPAEPSTILGPDCKGLPLRTLRRKR